MAKRTSRVMGVGLTNMRNDLPPALPAGAAPPSPRLSLPLYVNQDSQVSQINLDGTTASLKHPAKVSAPVMRVISPRFARPTASDLAKHPRAMTHRSMSRRLPPTPQLASAPATPSTPARRPSQPGTPRQGNSPQQQRRYQPTPPGSASRGKLAPLSPPVSPPTVQSPPAPPTPPPKLAAKGPLRAHAYTDVPSGSGNQYGEGGAHALVR